MAKPQATGNEQQENLDRVEAKLAGIVLDFCSQVIEHDYSVFYMEELRTFVVEKNAGPVAPDSPGRILRLLKRQRKIDYQVINRRESIYLLNEVKLG